MRFAIVLALLAGCGSGDSKLTPQKDKPAAKPTHAADEKAPAASPIVATELKPLVRAIGRGGQAPDKIVIELAQPVIDQEAMGDPGGTKLKITPEIAGELTWTSSSELTFTPAAPFELDKSYKVELLALETRDGVIDKPAGESWSYDFKTPAFAFNGWAPNATDFKAQTIVMELAFSAPVMPTMVAQNASITIDGGKPAGIQLMPSDDPHHVPFLIHDAKVAAGHKLSLNVSSLASVAGGNINIHADYVISQDKALSIKVANAVEGAGGFYVEVVCNDAAAPPGQRSYYDRGNYAALSSRCQLADAAASAIHFDPPVKGMYVTPGRAGFRIFGEFKRGAYGMKIDAGAVSVDGGVVLAPYAASFAVGARKPSLQFAGTGRYLGINEGALNGAQHAGTLHVFAQHRGFQVVVDLLFHTYNLPYLTV